VEIDCWIIGRSRRELAHWIRSKPGQEVCGLLAQESNGERRFVGIRNSTGMANHCEITRDEWDRALGCLQVRGWEPLAFVHSHLGWAEPSATDIENSRSCDLPWIIVSVVDKDIVAPAYAQLHHDAGDLRFFPIDTTRGFQMSKNIDSGSRSSDLKRCSAVLKRTF